MSKDTEVVGRSARILRKVSLRREDSGYASVMGTPADTPCVINGVANRRISRVEPPSLADIPESHRTSDCGELTPGSCPGQLTPYMQPEFHNQLSMPNEEHSVHSAPMGRKTVSPPFLNRTHSLEFGRFGNSYHGYFNYKHVSERAEEIINEFSENTAEFVDIPSVDSFSIATSPPPPRGVQRQFSEFPLDQNVLTVGQDGHYLEDRDYNIVREAGAGGSASCNLGNDRGKCTQFIIKKRNRSRGGEDEQDMIRESQILRQISHENVIRFYGAVEDLADHSFKIFLEYAESTCGDIHYLFCECDDKGCYSGNIALIMLYVQQMLVAVDYLHWSRNILHLDIKGKNIVVCNGGYQVKLIDFGTACKATSAMPPRTGWTPVHAAPEINNSSQPPKFSADIWSIMCVAVEMVTGMLPWQLSGEVTHEMALFKIGLYEDDQITHLVQYDDYWDKYSYSNQATDMYQELVDMWKQVFIKESSCRPSAYDLLHLNWMHTMKLEGESILQGLVDGSEESYGVEQNVGNDDVGIMMSPPSIECHPTQDYLNDEDSMSYHSFAQPGQASPYLSTSPNVSLSYQHSNHLSSSPGSDRDSFGRNSFNSRDQLPGAPTYIAEQCFLTSTGPSSLPTYAPYHADMMARSNSVNYPATSTPLVQSVMTQQSLGMDFTDGREETLSSSLSGRGRSRSFSVYSKPAALNTTEQVVDKRRKSLCYIGQSKSDPINVLNAAGIMESNMKRVNSLQYVSEGPKTDSPVSSPKVGNPPSSLTLDKTWGSGRAPPRRRRSSSDTPTESFTSSVMDSGIGRSLEERSISRSLEERLIRRSISVEHDVTSAIRYSKLSLPDRDEHRPDGCSEPSEVNPHTLQLSSPKNSNKPQHVEVNGSTTVNELWKMTSKPEDGLILKIGTNQTILK